MRRIMCAIVVCFLSLFICSAAGATVFPGYICSGTVFGDVSSGSVGGAFCGYIEHFSSLGITSGCSVNPPLYCPDGNVTRAQMAIFVSKALDKVKPPRTALVAPLGGDYPNPVTAMNDLATWCRPVVDISSPCLLKIAPGTYDLGTTSLQMQEFVDIEGAGENVTVITGHADGPATIMGASNAELRFLTVKNTGGGSTAVAIANISASTRITNVTATAEGAGDNHAIENHGGGNASLPLIIRNVIAIASNQGGVNVGILNDSGASPVIENVHAVAWGGDENYGIANVSANPQMRGVTALAQGGTVSNGIINDASGGQMFDVSATAVDGTNNNGILNQNSSGPVMKNVRAEGSGGTNSSGLHNENCGNVHTIITGLSAIGHNATGGNAGVYIHACSQTLVSAFISATPGIPGAAHHGIFSDAASVTVQSSLIRVPVNSPVCSGGCYGVTGVTSGAITVDSSQVYAYTNTVSIRDEVVTGVGNTKLSGGQASNVGTGILKCIGAYNDSYDALNSSCQ